VHIHCYVTRNSDDGGKGNPETVDCNAILTWLITREDFILFSNITCFSALKLWESVSAEKFVLLDFTRWESYLGKRIFLRSVLELLLCWKSCYCISSSGQQFLIIILWLLGHLLTTLIHKIWSLRGESYIEKISMSYMWECTSNLKIP
jgi:hypothetical protein